MKPLTFSSTDLPRLLDQLEAWRQRQTGRRRLPPELWQAAARLAATHSVSSVARALRIDFYRLQRQTQLVSAATAKTPVPPPFVELKLDMPTRSAGAASGWVELSVGPQRRMRLHTGHDPAAWVALAEAFWRTAP
jgi:hypothetical protein